MWWKNCFHFTTCGRIEWSFHIWSRLGTKNLPNRRDSALVLISQRLLFNITADNSGPDKAVLGKTPWGNWQNHKDGESSAVRVANVLVYLLLCTLRSISLPSKHCQVLFSLQWRFLSFVLWIWFATWTAFEILNVLLIFTLNMLYFGSFFRCKWNLYVFTALVASISIANRRKSLRPSWISHK